MSNPFAPPGNNPEEEANRTPGEPQFGQRSDQWSSEPGSSQTDPYSSPDSSQGGSNAGGDAGAPWPVYGQGQTQGQSPYPQQMPNYGAPQVPNQQAPQNYGAPNFGANSYQGQPQPFPQYGQVPNAGQPGVPYGQGMNKPSGPPPSRAGAIWTLVVGIVLMVLVAPATFVGLIIGGFGVNSFTDGSLIAYNNDFVMVDETGVVGVSPLESTYADCVLMSENDDMYQMVDESNSGVHVARGLPAGEYFVSCDGVGEYSELLFFTGDMVNNLMSTTMAAFGWASLVGVVGLGLTITGIVWLVRKNRTRRDFFYGSRF